MKILICGSMQFSEKMLETKVSLEKLGHEAFVSKTIQPFIGKTDAEKEKIKIQQKFKEGVMKEYWYLLPEADAVLILNYDKNEIKNYIGGNAFMEMSWAYALDKKIFLINPIPKIPYYETEIKAMGTVVINNDFKKIK